MRAKYYLYHVALMALILSITYSCDVIGSLIGKPDGAIEAPLVRSPQARYYDAYLYYVQGDKLRFDPDGVVIMDSTSTSILWYYAGGRYLHPGKTLVTIEEFKLTREDIRRFDSLVEVAKWKYPVKDSIPWDGGWRYIY